MVGKVNWQNFPVRQAVPYHVQVYALSGKGGMRQMRARRPQHAILSDGFQPGYTSYYINAAFKDLNANKFIKLNLGPASFL